MRLLSLAGSGIKGAKTQVAMRLERAHAELFCQRQGLAVGGFGLVDVQGLAVPGNIAEETAGMRLVTASWVGAGEFEEALGKCARLVHAADEEQGLAQLGEHKLMGEHTVPGGNALQHLVQEREGLRSMPGESIRRT